VPNPLAEAGLTPRSLPFLLSGAWIVAVALFPYHPAMPLLTAAGIGAGVVMSAALGLFPWRRLPRWCVLLPFAVGCAAIGVIIAGQGSLDVGLIALYALPILWSALYGGGTETVAVTLFAAASVFALGRISGSTRTGDGTQVVLGWTAAAALVAYTVHALRSQLAGTIRSREEVIRRGAVIDLAGAELFSSLNPDSVVSIGLHAAAHLMLPESELAKEALFFVVDEEGITLTQQYDERDPTPASLDLTIPGAGFPLLRRALQAESLLCFTAADLVSAVPKQLASRFQNISGGVAATVRAPGVNGVLIVPRHDGRPFAPSDLDLLSALRTIFELALSRAVEYAKDATVDPLTGLANRRELHRRLRSLPRGMTCALLSIDVDGLKRVNDQAGHAAGDALLCEVAEAMRRCVRRGDVVARLGGDEFCALLTHTQPAGAARIAARMVQQVRLIQAVDRPAAISVGVALLSESDDPLRRLEAADAAMYRAKAAGGARVVVDADAPAHAEAAMIH
jgi:diguanylate cyclase (GGDEF)-like protein